MPTYPECEKMAAIQEKSQTIGEFLEWLQSGEVFQNLPLKRPIFLAAYDVEIHDRHGEVLPEDEWELGDEIVRYSYNTERLLAEFFGIDLDKVEQEKQAMLEELRNEQRSQRRTDEVHH